MADIQALREELSNPAIGSAAHLRKLALSLLDELEFEKNTLFAAQQRIFELEARTLSVKLPDPSSKAFWSGSGKNETFYPSTYKIWVKESIERAGVIAGISVKVV